MLEITKKIKIPDNEISFSAIRSSGSGGQNVNKVATAIHLRFDIEKSSLDDKYKERLLNLKDSRISDDGIIIIKAQSFRTQEKNKSDSIKRLKEIIKKVLTVPKKRRPTKPSKSSDRKRLDSKSKRAKLKSLRKSFED